MTDDVSMWRRARRGDEQLVVVEGVHAWKHAWRFGASFAATCTPDATAAVDLMRQLGGDDAAAALAVTVTEVTPAVFAVLAPHAQRTGLIALAQRPVDVPIASWDAARPIVLLEDPRDATNIGAVVRTAAAWGAAGVAVSGDHNPWQADAIRCAAGLHWALPVVGAADLATLAAGRTVVALDADGEVLGQESTLVAAAVVVFGTERAGISAAVRQRADRIVALPMRAGVSSLNLAASVAATLYGVRWVADDGGILKG